MRLLRLTLLSAIVWLVGCASAFDTRPIAQKYSKQLQLLSPGISLNTFSKVMPNTYLKGQNVVDGLRIDAYELTWRHAEHMMGHRVTERLWFYFHNNQLVRWGEPGDWPARGDIPVWGRN